VQQSEATSYMHVSNTACSILIPLDTDNYQEICLTQFFIEYFLNNSYTFLN